MKEQFEQFNFRNSTLNIIDQANGIIHEYLADDLKLTVRQLYYQFVARDLIANTQREYHKLVNILTKARLAGLIDWEAIEDRTRNLEYKPYWKNPEQILKSAAKQYRRDLWKPQDYRLEVWIEKEALSGVIANICDNLHVPYFACRGYVSSSELYGAGKRLAKHLNKGQSVAILHLGDHDPSGIDMTRDNANRLRIFAEDFVDIERLALNFDQIELYNPPPNPAKSTDSRFPNYHALHGNESWELDALDPRVMQELIEEAVYAYRDPDLWEKELEKQEQERQAIIKAAESL